MHAEIESEAEAQGSPRTAAAFTGSIPELYERHLVPLLFETFADDLARRVVRRSPLRVLEIAAGTGVVTRRLASELGLSVEIVATDLNPDMLERAAAVGTRRPVVWQQADASALPFANERFDVVVCQFGVMFFPDKVQAFSEARRVLRGGGLFLFNVWDRVEANDFAATARQVIAERFTAEVPRFMAVPYGYHDAAMVARDLAASGFDHAPQVELVRARSRASSAQDAALAICQGTPLRHEIEAHDPSALDATTAAVAAAIAGRFGADPSGAVVGGLQAYVVSIER